MSDVDAVKRNSACFLAMGVTLIVLGAIAIAAAVATTLISVMIFGWLLLISGLLHIVQTIWVRPWHASLLPILIGVLNVIIGLLIVANPGVSALALTLLMAAFFGIAGVFRIIHAAEQRFPGRPWALFNGAVNILLGILIWLQWPASAFWVIGLFIGIDLVFAGCWFIALTTIARRETASTPSASPAT